MQPTDTEQRQEAQKMEPATEKIKGCPHCGGSACLNSNYSYNAEHILYLLNAIYAAHKARYITAIQNRRRIIGTTKAA